MGQCIIMTGGYAGDSSDDCTATKSQVLEGYKAITKDSNDDAELGIMPNKGAWTSRIGINGKAIIPAGYHNGSGYVDQTITNRGAWGTSIGINGNITIPEGYHNGQGHVTQSIATMGGQTITPSASQQTVACSGKYMTGNVVVNASPWNCKLIWSGNNGPEEEIVPTYNAKYNLGDPSIYQAFIIRITALTVNNKSSIIGVFYVDQNESSGALWNTSQEAFSTDMYLRRTDLNVWCLGHSWEQHFTKLKIIKLGYILK